MIKLINDDFISVLERNTGREILAIMLVRGNHAVMIQALEVLTMMMFKLKVSGKTPINTLVQVLALGLS